MNAEEFIKESEEYRKVLDHRRSCKHWGKTFCLNCFGGGLVKFVSKLDQEFLRKKKVKKQ